MRKQLAHLAISPKQILYGGIISALCSLLFALNVRMGTSRNRMGNCCGQSWPGLPPKTWPVDRLCKYSLNLASAASLDSAGNVSTVNMQMPKCDQVIHCP